VTHGALSLNRHRIDRAIVLIVICVVAVGAFVYLLFDDIHIPTV
jgi:hypothetical protein